MTLAKIIVIITTSTIIRISKIAQVISLPVSGAYHFLGTVQLKGPSSDKNLDWIRVSLRKSPNIKKVNKSFPRIQSTPKTRLVRVKPLSKEC